MKVLHVCAPARIGGLESVVVQLTTGLRSLGVDAQVAVVGAAAEAGAAAFSDRLTHEGVPVHRVYAGGREYSRERAEIRELLRTNRFRVLHSHGYRADVIDGPVAHRVGCAHVSTLHGFTAKGIRGRIYEYLQVRQAARADAAIAVSTAIASRVRKVRESAPVHVIRNSIGEPKVELPREEARRRLGIADDMPCVGWVGRLSFEKGPDIALQALQRVPDIARLVFVGDGPMRAELESRWERAVSDGRVVFAGVRDDARSLMSAFNVLAITSRTEGTPITLLEAMWSRVPTVVSAVGGIPEVVDGSMSELVEPEAEAIAQAIHRVLSNPGQSAARVDAAEKRVREHHDVRRWLEAHLAVYQGVGAETS